MKKKVVSLLLVMCIICIGTMFTSCNSAVKLVEDAVNKTSELDSYAAKMIMKIEMNVDGSTINVPVTIDMKVANAKSNKPLISADYEMSIFGQKANMDMYSDGEWMYISMEDMDYKISMEEAKDEGYSFTEDAQDLLKNLPEDVLKDVKIVKNNDGTKTVAVDITAEDLETIFGDIVDDISDEYSEDGDAELGDATVEITVDKSGYILVYKLNMTLKMEFEGIESDCKAEISMEFDDPGKDVEVTPIEGYEDFQEIGSGLFF